METPYLLKIYDSVEVKINARNHLVCDRTIGDLYYFRHRFLWEIDELGSLGKLDGVILKRYKNMVLVERGYSFKRESIEGIASIALKLFSYPIKNKK